MGGSPFRPANELQLRRRNKALNVEHFAGSATGHVPKRHSDLVCRSVPKRHSDSYAEVSRNAIPTAKVQSFSGAAALRVSRIYVSLSVTPTANCMYSAVDGAGMLRPSLPPPMKIWDWMIRLRWRLLSGLSGECGGGDGRVSGDDVRWRAFWARQVPTSTTFPRPRGL